MTSPVASKLATNYCPTDEESLQIRALLVEPTSRLQQLDEKIRVLTEERDELAAFIAGHQALLAPIRRVPSDVLQEIFERCTPSGTNCVMSSTEAPAVLTHVCGPWRTLALATPSLWSRVHVVEPLSHRTPAFPALHQPLPPVILQAQVARRLEAVNTWLSRTGNAYPLSISFDGDSATRTAADSIPSTTLFINALLRFVHRWQHIHFTFWPDPATLQPVLQLTPEKLPSLRSLSITNNGTESSNALFSAGSAFGAFMQAPRFSRLRISRIPVEIETLALRWDELTEVYIADTNRRMTAETIFEILRRCPRLRRGTFGPVCNPTLSTPLHPIECPALEFLEWHVYNGDVAGFQHILCPSLRSLSIKTTSFATNIDAAYLERFFKNHAILSVLEYFELAVWIDESDLIMLASVLPASLHSFTLGHQQGHRDFESVITDDLLRNLSGLLPNLQKLHLRDCVALSSDAILAFLHAHREHLKRVYIGYARYAQDQSEAEWKATYAEFIDAGMSVELVYLPLPASSGPKRGLLLDEYGPGLV
ncbi:hypothetical protein C8F01DRAFT_1171358 [Mycena amicta]|nr:hypothetical protein C8F01DRAFT_1171358 [Mycena amicta]